MCSFKCSSRSLFTNLCFHLYLDIKGIAVILMCDTLVAGDFRGRRGRRCRRCEKGVLPPDHERASGSKVWDVPLLRGVQTHLVFKQGTCL